MARRRTGYLWLLLVAIVLGGGITWGLWPRPMAVDSAVVSRGTVVVSVREDGRTRVRERYVVSSPLTGQLLRIDLEPGDQVEKQGTILATLQAADPGLLDARTRSEAMAQIRAAGAMVKQAEASVEKAKQAASLAAGEYQRASTLVQNDLVSDERYEQLEHAERMAQAELRSAEFALEVARFQREQAEAAFVRDYAEQPSDSDEPTTEIPASESIETEEEPEQILVMKAPVTGRVLRVFQESAGPVQVGTPILELGDPVDLEVEVDVLSEDAVRIAPGAAVVIDQWGGEGVLEGVVARVEPAAFVKVSALGVEEHRVNVIIDFREPAERFASLGDGYRIEAAIEIARATDVLTVPSDALFREDTKWALFVIDAENIARKRTVEVGLTDGLTTEVLSGLTEGEIVITHPSNLLTEGQIVKRNEATE